jgi:transposase-like protein
MDIRLENRDPALLLALDYIYQNPNHSIRSIAKKFGVNRSTLSRHLVRPTSRVIAHECSQRLSYRQERFLVDWIKDEETRGYAPSRSRVYEMAQKLLAALGDDKPLGHKWIDGFKKRNPDIKTLSGRRIASERYNGASYEVLITHFHRFKQLIDQYAVKTCNIFNMDEAGTQLGASLATLVLGDTSHKTATIKKPNETEWVSIIECISALGVKLPPLIIFKGKSIQLQWFNPSELPDWYFTTSTNGWTSNEIGMKWLESVFIPKTACQAGDYRLLVLDGHGSHVSTDFMYTCKMNKILLLYLPPHTSHCTQPLDLTCFSPVKSQYRKEIQELAALDNSAKVKKERFIAAYKKARDGGLTEKVIRSGFKAAGLIPYNPNKVLLSHFVRRPQTTPKSQKIRSRRQKSRTISPTTPKRFKDLIQQVETITSRSENDSFGRLESA